MLTVPVLFIDLAPSESNIKYDQMFTHAVTAPFSRKGLIPISIDGIIFEALIDTGAEVSYVALSVYNRLNLKHYTLAPKQILKHVGGDTMETLGSGTSTLNIAEVLFTHTCHVHVICHCGLAGSTLV